MIGNSKQVVIQVFDSKLTSKTHTLFYYINISIKTNNFLIPSGYIEKNLKV